MISGFYILLFIDKMEEEKEMLDNDEKEEITTQNIDINKGLYPFSIVWTPSNL